MSRTFLLPSIASENNYYAPLLRPVSSWTQTPFSEFSPLPREGKALSDLSSKDLDKVLNKITDDIHELVKRLQKGEDNH